LLSYSRKNTRHSKLPLRSLPAEGVSGAKKCPLMKKDSVPDSVPAEDVKDRADDETSTGNRYWVVDPVRLEVSPGKHMS
jgi:hypothetical protein